MGLPNYLKSALGTAIVWGQPGASGVTKDLTLNALASGSARMGAKADLGATFDEDYVAIVIAETGSAPTAGFTADLFLAYSYDDTTWPGGVTGSDGAWPADGNEDEWLAQLAEGFIGSFKATNDANTVGIQNAIVFRPATRYVAPVFDNNLGQAIRNEGTATDNNSRVILIPKRHLIQQDA